MSEPALILIVDDEDAGRFVKTQTLARAGFRILEAATGRDALRLAASATPDLIILDVNLPDISGLEVCRLLKSDQRAHAVHVLHVSNTAISDSDRARGLEGGADAYLTEPLGADVLIATVHAVLRMRRAELACADAVERERKAREDAEEANRLKDEFLAT